MELSYDEVADTLYIYFDHSPVEYSEKMNASVILDYDTDGKIRGVEVLNFSNSNLDLNQIIRLSKNELIAQVSTQ